MKKFYLQFGFNPADLSNLIPNHPLHRGMPAQIQCPRCRREHSVEDYEADRFCRSCGTSLRVSLGDKQSITWQQLFPYEPYPQQLEFINDVIKTVGNGGVLVAEACNGFGKTVSALSCLLAMGKKVVHATRTHEQVKQVLTEISKINEKGGTGYTAVNLASRRFMCVNPECRRLPLSEAQEHCRVLRKDENCPFESELSAAPRSLPPVKPRELLVSYGKRRNVCPYYLARLLSKESDVVVCPYPYVFNPMIRLTTGMDLEGKVIILDEGHNIDKVSQDILSDTLSERGLEAATEELKLIGKPMTHVRRLEAFLVNLDVEKPRAVKGTKLELDLENALRTGLDSFVESHAPLVDAIRAKKMQSGKPPSSNLNGLLGFIELLQTSPKSKYIAIYTRNYYGANVIEYRCLDPSLAVKPVVDSANGAIIMSGTISPVDLFAEIIGLGNSMKKVYDPIQDPKNVRMVIDSTVSTAYRERSDKMIKSLGKIISDELDSVRQGALVFFPQRLFMNHCIEVWRSSGIISTSNGRLYLGEKRMFREGRDAEQNTEVTQRYRRVATGVGGAVLLCVFRGRNSEGSNFPDDQARGIFLVGVPYANYGDPLVKEQIRYFNGQKRGLGNRWYTMDAFRAANQSLGRGIRSRTDWCHYWLLDRRYKEHRNLISGWAKLGGVEIVSEHKPKFPGFKRLSEA